MRTDVGRSRTEFGRMSSGFVQTQADMRERERLRGREWLRASLTGHEWLRASLIGHEWLRASLTGHEWLRADLTGREWLRADLTGREYRCEMAKCIFTRKNTFLGVVGV